MRRILITILTLLTLLSVSYGQSRANKGITIGENGDIIDSVQNDGGYKFYSGADRVQVDKDTTDALRTSNNTNAAAIIVNTDTSEAQRLNINANLDSVILHRLELIEQMLDDRNFVTRINALEKGRKEVPHPNATLILHYRFEQDSLDETGYRHNFIPSSLFQYADPFDAEDTYVGSFETVNRYVTTPSLDLTADFIVSVDAFIYNDSTGNRTLASGDGWYLKISGDTVKVVTTIDSIYCTNAITVDTVVSRATHIAVTTDNLIFINGIKQTVVGTLTAGFDSNGTVVAGQTKAGTESFYGYEDNLKLLTGSMDSTALSNEYKASQYYKPPDIVNPTIISAVVDLANVIVLGFDKPVYNYVEDSLITALTLTANDSLITINAAEYYSFGKNIALNIDSITEGASLKLSYARGDYTGLQDWTGNLLLPIYQQTVTNNYTEPFIDVVTLRYPFDGNGLEFVSGYTALDTAIWEWNDLIFIEGTQSVQLNGSSGKLWIPSSYNSNPDVITISMRVYLTENSGSSYELIENFSATPFKIEFRATGRDIYVYVDGNVATALSVTTANPSPTDVWYHIAVVYTKSTGAVLIYFDGVDVTTDGTAAAGADLSGPFRLFGVTKGLLDDLQVYDLGLTPAEIILLAATPGYVVQRKGTPPTPDPVLGVIDTLFFWDFETPALGPYSREDFTNDFNAEFVTSTSWNYSGLSSSTEPYIIDYNVEIDGVATTSQGLRLTRIAGATSAEHVPLESRCILPQKANNTDVYVQFDIKTLSPGWSQITYNTGGKTVGLWANYFPTQEKYFSTGNPTGLFRENARWGEGNAAYHVHTGYFGVPENTSQEIVEITEAFRDTDGSTLHVPHGTNLDSMYRVTLRMVTGPNGFTEYFHNNVLVGTNYNHGYDMTGFTVDIMKFGWTFNYGDQHITPDNVVTILDNVFVYRYKSTWTPGKWMERSDPGRPLYTTTPEHR